MEFFQSPIALPRGAPPFSKASLVSHGRCRCGHFWILFRGYFGVGGGQICHGAAELLHTHFCCTQWHASAFDERLEDDAFLHTADSPAPGASASAPGTDVRAELGSAAGAAEPVPGSASDEESFVSSVAGASSRHGEVADSRVKALHGRLVIQRRVLWEAMESKMVRKKNAETDANG